MVCTACYFSESSSSSSALHLILIFLLFSTTTTLSSTHVPSLHTARTSTTERRTCREVNVLLGIQTNNEGRDVDDLLTDAVKWIKSNKEYSINDINTSS